MATESNLPYVIPKEETKPSEGMISKLTTWAGENKLTAVIIAIVIIVALYWWATDKGYIEKFQLKRKSSKDEDSDNDDDEDSDDEGELEEEIDDILKEQTKIWNEKVTKNDIIP